MRHGFLLFTLVLASACTRSPSTPRVAGIQVVCYGDGGQLLFPAQVVDSVDLQNNGMIEATYSNGMHLWIRAPSCVMAEMNADDFASLKAKANTSSKPVTAPGAPAPVPVPHPPEK